MTNTKPRKEIESRAKRVKALRKGLKLSRRAFQKRTGIPYSTLQHWEEPGNGLGEKGALRLARQLKSCGVDVSVSWLLFGQGVAPEWLGASMSLPKRQSSDDVAHRKAELDFFLGAHKDGIHIEEDGALFAGVCLYNEAIAHLVGERCIVLTKTGELLLCEHRVSGIPGYYNLKLADGSVKEEVELVSAAKVIWWRGVP